MLSNSFTWWVVNFFVALFWLAGSVATGNYFLALGGLFYVAFMMLVDLPGTSSEEGSAERDADSPDDGIEPL